MSETNLWLKKFSTVSILGGNELGRGFALALAREHTDLAVCLLVAQPREARRHLHALGEQPRNLAVLSTEDRDADLVSGPDSGPLFICDGDERASGLIVNRPVIVALASPEMSAETYARRFPTASLLAFGAQPARERVIEAIAWGYGIAASELETLSTVGFSGLDLVPLLSKVPGLEDGILATPVDEVMSRFRQYESLYSDAPEIVAAVTAEEFAKLYGENPEISRLRRAHLLIRAAARAIGRSEIPVSGGGGCMRAMDRLLDLVRAIRLQGVAELSGRLAGRGVFAAGFMDFASGEFTVPTGSVTERALLAELTLQYRAALGMHLGQLGLMASVQGTGPLESAL
jgi:hypothetical protein